jgi:hypothetical protein
MLKWALRRGINKLERSCHEDWAGQERIDEFERECRF